MPCKRKKPVRYYSPKRRKVYAQGDDISALVVFTMHGWICYVCREPINKFLRVPNYMAATIEHIIPISKGGTHTWDNVAPSHYKCNMDRGNLYTEDGEAGPLASVSVVC